MIETTAACPYCGQNHMVQIPEGMPIEAEAMAAVTEATRICTCPQGQRARIKQVCLDRAEQHIEDILREQHPEAADIFQRMKEEVFEGRIQKLTIREGTGGRAELRRTKEGIAVSFQKTTKTELQT